MPQHPSTPQPEHDFMRLLRLHEQNWGKFQYEGRPTLADLLRAPVVVFWQPVERPTKLLYTATTHLDTVELRKYVSRLVIHSELEPPKNRIVHIFVRRKLVQIKGVRLIFE
jgi:hypothetical protein